MWCICGHKEVFNGWSSNNKKLDEFIKGSQIQTNSANEAYLEWIPDDCLGPNLRSYCLPTSERVNLISLDIASDMDDLYYKVDISINEICHV